MEHKFAESADFLLLFIIKFLYNKLYLCLGFGKIAVHTNIVDYFNTASVYKIN